MSLNSILSGSATLEGYLICLTAALALGIVTALAYMYRSRHTGSMAITLALLPPAVQTVIFLVNGSIGIGVAVAGAFSLVRFRSLPGSARDITALFTAMGIGLAAGTGHLVIALAFSVAMAIALMALTHISFGEPKDNERELKITVPETLDYEGLFDDILSAYTGGFSLSRVRTTNMGSLYELTYLVVLPEKAGTRAFLNELRTRNGNLNIQLSRGIPAKEESL